MAADPINKPTDHAAAPGAEAAGGASRARVRDYWLGGRDHYGPDRVAGELIGAAAEWVPKLAAANLGFLHRAAADLAEAGFRQFLHLNCGLPTGVAIHQVVASPDLVDDDVVVAYVDHDPVVLSHARARLADPDSARIVVVDGSAGTIDQLLADEALQEQVDWTRPVVVLAHEVLQDLDDDDAREFLAQLRTGLAEGSVLAFTQPGPGSTPQQAAEAEQAAAVYRQLLGPFVLRDSKQLTDLLDGWQLTEPGLVPPDRWPDLAGGPPLPALAGVAQLPTTGPPFLPLAAASQP